MHLRVYSVIFDWDDTLLASSFLSSRGFRLDSVIDESDTALASQLRLLEESVINVITLARLHSTVIIVVGSGSSCHVHSYSLTLRPQVSP
jgi:hypothetical protein